jgi:phage tail sheath gpL-like
MAITSSSRARGVGVTADNTPLSLGAQQLPRKILLMGNYDETNKLTVVEDIAELLTSSADAADKYGYGFQLHRMALAAEDGSDGVEMWAVPVAENAAGAAATGTITIAVTTATAGTIPLYVAGERLQVAVADGDADSAIASACADAINADDNLPATASAALAVCTVTGKQASADSNDISLKTGVELEIQGDKIPDGVTVAIVAMSGGTGVSDYSTAFTNLGENDAANEDWYTDCVQGNGQDTTTMDETRDYVGAGNEAVGTYRDTVARPMKWYLGDNAAGSSGLSNLVTLGDGRKTDRANLIIAAPGSPDPEVEIACYHAGVCARINNEDAAKGYGGQTLTGILRGAKADRWTSDYTNRNTAVMAGVGTTRYENGVLVVSDSVSFYHPDSVLWASNGYAEGANPSKVQNISYNLRAWFESERYQGFTIVADTAKVTNITARQNARDEAFILGDLTALARAFEGEAWLYSAEKTITKLQEGGYVQIRGDGLGFIIIFPLVLSGVGKIIDLTYQFDTRIS